MWHLCWNLPNFDPLSMALTSPFSMEWLTQKYSRQKSSAVTTFQTSRGRGDLILTMVKVEAESGKTVSKGPEAKQNQ